MGQRVGDKTNLFLTHLDASGRPINAAPQFVATEASISAYSELYRAEDGFFLRYFDRTNSSSLAFRLLATRIDSSGNPAFAPMVISTNIFKESDTASNGRALLMLVENYSSRIRLDYTIVGSNGGIISNGELLAAPGGHSFAAASDGMDFLAVWSASAPPYLHVTRLSGTTGALNTAGIGPETMFVQTMAHGKNGYLVAGNSLIMLLRDDGTLVAKTNVIAIGTTHVQELIYPEGEGWILFTSDSAGSLRIFRVTPTTNGLRVDDSASYPAVQNVFSSSLTPPIVSTVAPFGAGRFLVAGNNGVSVLTKTGVSPAAQPLTYAQQTDSRIVASGFGYLMAWIERHDLGYSIRGVRFAPDGSHLDDHSFEIGTFYSDRFQGQSLVFDGKDYVLAWKVFDAPIRVARIAPQGAPDVRKSSAQAEEERAASEWRKQVRRRFHFKHHNRNDNGEDGVAEGFEAIFPCLSPAYADGEVVAWETEMRLAKKN